MSRSDKRVIARNEHLEPVTGQKYCRATVLGADVALCIGAFMRGNKPPVLPGEEKRAERQ